MQKNSEFKVGDIVRFKLNEEDQKYAIPHYNRTSNLKISEILSVRCGPNLVNFEGYPEGWSAFTFRLEKQPNMFAFGKKNPKMKKKFLDYTKDHQDTGLCGYLNDDTYLGYKCEEFLNKQIVFKYSSCYPVERFVLRSKKKSTSGVRALYEKQRYTYKSYTNSETPMGKLRIWWATNLAIAASQGKI